MATAICITATARTGYDMFKQLKEYRPAAVQFRESPTFSPDFDKTFVVRRGDTLSGIAGQVFRDPSRWREIARANDVVDPRRIRPGDALRIPKLR